jgi:hypothetical protein
VENPKPILDYSSQADEQKRDEAEERQRREGLENYAEATFGERRPIAMSFFRIVVFAAVIALIFLVFPRKVGMLIAALATLASVALQVRRSEWPRYGSRSMLSAHDTWWWWR